MSTKFITSAYTDLEHRGAGATLFTANAISTIKAIVVLLGHADWHVSFEK